MGTLFVISLTYKKELRIVDEYRDAHLEFVDQCFKDGLFLMAGPKVPRTGGIIIAKSKTKEALETLLHKDPFSIHHIADFHIEEFSPIRICQENISF